MIQNRSMVLVDRRTQFKKTKIPSHVSRILKKKKKKLSKTNFSVH